MIDSDFTFDLEQRFALERLKLNDMQINELERIVPACASYLNPRTAPTKNETRDVLEALLYRHIPALHALFAYEAVLPAEHEALTYIGRNMDLTQLFAFGQSVRDNLPTLSAAVNKALIEREADGQKRDTHNLMPLHLIFDALRNNHSATYDMDQWWEDEASTFRFYPSQSTTGPFAKVADAIYRLVTGDGDADKGTGVPERALEAFAKELRAGNSIKL
ncbi:hypothetical protein [Hyphomonas sp.]|uniref:hypothetical protein n=1 Tax=Hyphomonas sp. TaxID=87 RepID=UPI00391D0F26